MAGQVDTVVLSQTGTVNVAGQKGPVTRQTDSMAGQVDSVHLVVKQVL